MSKKRTWTEKQLQDAVKSCKSYRSVLIELGLKPTGGNYDQLKKYIKEYDLNIDHWTGKGWNKGKSFPVNKIKLLDNLKKDTNLNSNALRKKLIKSGMFEHKCNLCGLVSWRGNPIPLELDHINGIKTDNRIKNLRVLCPNCHALTPTYRGKNIKKK